MNDIDKKHRRVDKERQVALTCCGHTAFGCTTGHYGALQGSIGNYRTQSIFFWSSIWSMLLCSKTWQMFIFCEGRCMRSQGSADRTAWILTRA